MEGSAHYTLRQLRAWKNRIWQEREQLDREELFVEQRMAGACDRRYPGSALHRSRALRLAASILGVSRLWLW